MRDHAESAARQFARLGLKPKIAAVDEGPALAAEIAYLWRMFAEIMLGVGGNGMSPAVVTWEGLRAWAAFTRTELQPWEALALVQLGNLRARVISEEIDRRRPKGK